MIGSNPVANQDAEYAAARPRPMVNLAGRRLPFFYDAVAPRWTLGHNVRAATLGSARGVRSVCVHRARIRPGFPGPADRLCGRGPDLDRLPAPHRAAGELSPARAGAAAR